MKKGCLDPIPLEASFLWDPKTVMEEHSWPEQEEEES